MDSLQEKQAYLRDYILEKNYDPAQFVMFLNSKIPIGDNLDLCSLEELKDIVKQFLAMKEGKTSSFQPVNVGRSSVVDMNSRISDHQNSQFYPKQSTRDRPNYSAQVEKEMKNKNIYIGAESQVKEPSKIKGPSVMYKGRSVVNQEPSNVYKEPSAFYKEPSNVYQEPSNVYNKNPSTIQREPVRQHKEPPRHQQESMVKQPVREGRDRKNSSQRQQQKQQPKQPGKQKGDHKQLQRYKDTSQILPRNSEIRKPRQVLFTKYMPNLLENQFMRTYECEKIYDKYGSIKNIKCTVTDAERKNSSGVFGLGGTSFLEFKVTTPELKWKVGRRYSDFVWLRTYLLKAYPAYIIPPIPEKKAAKRTQQHIQKRMKILQYFLNDLINIREIFNDRFVEGFLSINNPSQFQNLKKQSQKVKDGSVNDHKNFQGNVNAMLTQQNKQFFDLMTTKVPEFQRLYKQITRGGKKLQRIITDEVNTLYDVGNLFADLHEQTKQMMKRLPKMKPIAGLNDVFITLNNMMVEWGNLARNQYEMLEKNFNTYFKYVRNQLFGYTELINRELEAEAEYAKVKAVVEKKKQKIYNLHDPTKWELPQKELASVQKDMVHDKAVAFKIMLPKETENLKKLKAKTFFFLDQFFIQGGRTIQQTNVKFAQNFKQFSSKSRKNNKNLQEMWNQISVSFSGPTKKKSIIPSSIMEHPDDIKGQQLYDD